MICDDWKAFHQDYATGALSEGARAAVERHLATCPDCAADLRLVQRIETSLREEADREAPAGLVDRVLARTHPAAPRSLRREFLRLAAAAAVLVSATVAWAPLDKARPVLELSTSLFESARAEVTKALDF